MLPPRPPTPPPACSYGYTPLPSARMLAVSGNSKVNGPTIVWVSSQSFGPTLMPVSGQPRA